MKYTIETTDDGCVETLEIGGDKFTKAHKRTVDGCQAKDDEFHEQLEAAGYCEEILDLVYETYDGFQALNFLKLAELE